MKHMKLSSLDKLIKFSCFSFSFAVNTFTNRSGGKYAYQFKREKDTNHVQVFIEVYWWLVMMLWCLLEFNYSGKKKKEV